MKDELEIAPGANVACLHCKEYSIYKKRCSFGIIEEIKEYYNSSGFMTKEVVWYYHPDDNVRHKTYDAALKSARKKGLIK